MKQHFLFMILCLLSAGPLPAQREPGVLRVRFDDRHPLTVAVNDRRFPKIAGSLTIGDLPRRRSYLDVYEYRAYKDGGGHARLVFSGKVRVRPGMVTYCIVERTTGRVKIYTREPVAANDYSDPLFDQGSALPLPPAAAQTEPSPQPRISPLSADSMKILEQETIVHITDADKGVFLQQALSDKSVQTAQVRKMLSWFGSETSRLEFAKWAYDHVSDPDVFLSLQDVFIYENSREELEQYISAR